MKKTSCLLLATALAFGASPASAFAEIATGDAPSWSDLSCHDPELPGGEDGEPTDTGECTDWDLYFGLECLEDWGGGETGGGETGGGETGGGETGGGDTGGDTGGGDTGGGDTGGGDTGGGDTGGGDTGGGDVYTMPDGTTVTVDVGDVDVFVGGDGGTVIWINESNGAGEEPPADAPMQHRLVWLFSQIAEGQTFLLADPSTNTAVRYRVLRKLRTQSAYDTAHHVLLERETRTPEMKRYVSLNAWSDGGSVHEE